MKRAVLSYLLVCYLMVFVTLLGLCALGFAIAGFYLFLVQSLAVWAAALLTAGAVLVLAVTLLIVGWLTARGARETHDRRGEDEQQNEISRLLLELMASSDFNARDASLVALLAGAALGASPELREQIFSLFRTNKRRD